jgi:hypothetical protein
MWIFINVKKTSMGAIESFVASKFRSQNIVVNHDDSTAQKATTAMLSNPRITCEPQNWALHECHPQTRPPLMMWMHLPSVHSNIIHRIQYENKQLPIQLRGHMLAHNDPSSQKCGNGTQI